MEDTTNPPQPGEEGARILVVEDDEFLRELIVGKLKREGFHVSEAINGKAGLQKMKEDMPQLVLLDLILPGFNGFEVLSHIQGDPSIANIPVVVLSNLGQKEDIDRARELGAKGYLVKAQFTPSEIVEKVRAFLRGDYSW
jgi:DNA-binding response OmpR family regulator